MIVCNFCTCRSIFVNNSDHVLLLKQGVFYVYSGVLRCTRSSSSLPSFMLEFFLTATIWIYLLLLFSNLDSEHIHLLWSSEIASTLAPSRNKCAHFSVLCWITGPFLRTNLCVNAACTQNACTVFKYANYFVCNGYDLWMSIFHYILCGTLNPD